MLDNFHISGMHSLTKCTWHLVQWIDLVELINSDLQWIESSLPTLQSYTGASNRCIHTDIIHEAEKWNHDEWLDCSFMQPHTLIHKRKAPKCARTHTRTHAHTNSLHTQAALKPSQNFSVSLISSQHKLKTHQERDEKSVIFTYFWCAIFTLTLTWVFLLCPAQQTTF